MKHHTTFSIAGFLTFLLAIPASLPAADGEPADARPPFDKTPLLHKIWAQHENESITTAQFPFCIDRQLARSYGNVVADYAYLAHELDEVGIDYVFHINLGNMDKTEPMLEGFRAADNGKRAIGTSDAIHYELSQGTPKDAVVKYWVDYLKKNEKLLRTHPNYARSGNRPIVSVYGGIGTTPEIWREALPEIEAQAYPCVWIMTFDGTGLDGAKPWLPLFDGFTWYSPPYPPDEMKKIKDYLDSHYPQKLLLPTVKGKWNPADYCLTGIDVGNFTRNLRSSLDMALPLAADGITLNELAEFQEQSQIVPTYQLWDSFWRICAEKLRPLRNGGDRTAERSEPELLLSSRTDLLAGDVLEIEVVGFRLPPEASAVELDLRLADDRGDEIFRFPERTLDCGDMAEALYRTGTAQFADKLAVYPVLRYRWQGREFGPCRFRGSRLWIGDCPSDQIWSTPVDRVATDLEPVFWAQQIGRDPRRRILAAGRESSNPEYQRIKRWAFPGAPLQVDAGGMLLACDDIEGIWLRRITAPAEGIAAWQGTSYCNLLANGWNSRFDSPFYLYRSSQAPPLVRLEAEAVKTRMVSIPCKDVAGATGDVYTSEQPAGGMTSLPLYLVSDRKFLEPCDAQIAVFSPDDPVLERMRNGYNNAGQIIGIRPVEIRTVRVPEYRIPFFDYRFDEDRGSFAMDAGGYEHHGWMGGNAANNGGGSPWLITGYAFQNYSWAIWPIGTELRPGTPEFVQDDDGTGCLKFDGVDDRVLLPPRTLMPYSETVELVVKPEQSGRRMVLFSGQGNRNGTGYIKMRIGFTPELKVEVQFADGSSLVGDESVSPSTWSHIAVVNDSHLLTVYLNGWITASCPAPEPDWAWRMLSFVHLGFDSGGMDHTYSSWNLAQVRDRYRGKLRRVKISGRALVPEEFCETAPVRPK